MALLRHIFEGHEHYELNADIVTALMFSKEVLNHSELKFR